MSSRHRAAAAGWAAGLAAVLAAGCSDGPKTATVSGVVKVAGKAPEKGSVTFVPADGKGVTAGGSIGPNGRYTATGVPYGRMKVEVRVPKVVGKKALYGKDGPYMDVLDEVLPDKYHNSTELTFDVSGNTTKDWDLTPK
ncbi:hypothetical protein J0H58_26650 [bacterium]|nr:hypothetical protein [bacterium]